MPVSVFSIQTPLLGNKTYAELLRRSLRASSEIAFHARWSTELRERDEQEYRRLYARLLYRVFSTMSRRRWVRERNLDFYSFRYELGTSYWARRLVADMAREARPDVLHFHTQALAWLSIDLMRRFPTVISADMTAKLFAGQDVRGGWDWTFAPSCVLERRALRSAAAVVALSRWVAESMIENYEIAPERVHVVPPGVDLSQFPIVHPARRMRTGTRRILFVGGEYVRKGGPLLVEVFLNQFIDADVELDLVTPEQDVPEHPKITVHRGVSAFSPVWKRLYEEADVFVLPTRRDALGLVYLEAMAAGLPVIGTDVGAASEIIQDGETGFLIPADDPRLLTERIRALLGDAELRRRLGENGRRRVERHFEARATTRALEQIFVDVARR